MTASTLDLRALEAEVTRMRHKVEEWALSRMQAASGRKDQYLVFMADHAERYTSLQGRKCQVTLAAERTQQRLHDEELELRREQDHVAREKAKTEAAAERVQAAQQALLSKKEEYMRQVEEVESKSAKQLQGLEHYRKKAALYADRFGLRIVQGNGEVRLVWTHVDPLDHNREFVLGLRYKDSVYKVTKCEPMMPNLEDLTAEINRTNDLHAFVKAVRCGFVRVVQQVQAL